MAKLNEVAGDKIVEKPVSWEWRNHFSAGKVSIIFGPAGQGKTLIACDLIARITTGDTWPDSTTARLGNVLYIANGDDDPADTLKPRLIAAGADATRYSFIESVTGDDGKPRPFNIDKDDELLERRVAEMPEQESRWVFIDPLLNSMGKDVDIAKATVVYPMMSKLARIASKHHAVVVVIGHPRKLSEGAAWASLEEVMGSVSFGAAVRSAFVVRLRGHTGVFACAKVSNGPRPKARKYSIVDSDLVIAGERVGRIDWGEVVEEVADPEPTTEKDTKLEAAKAFLVSLLSGTWVSRSDVLAKGKAMGHSARTIERASYDLRVEKERGKLGGSTFAWRLPAGPGGGGGVGGVVELEKLAKVAEVNSATNTTATKGPTTPTEDRPVSDLWQSPVGA